ncbi:glycosyltransferase family 4 protein [Acetivibrio clariflavus]|uniref:Glycosyltransferase n=1 Tax=Acetivibrio clariflavus (strain DSM 19732 / NBRC 101661 / EBR45) TaxID=720554 RepID=G8M353_ACECE|nr:glycosyltransferase family 4 protein [Acetivibrio clariflavus]AEV69362.1 glycosyltransferase [Acetivibrio clariflavus DSM 19732]
MRILAVAHDKEFIGGANRSLLMVLSSLKANYNVECDVLLPGKDGSFESKLKEAGINCIVSSYKGVFCACKGDKKDILRKVNVHFKYIKQKFLGRQLAKQLGDKKYDLIYTNTRFPAVGAEIAHCLKIPHICHIREIGSPAMYCGKWSYSEIYRKSDKIILISQALYNRVAEDVPTDKLVMIYNGISGDIGLPVHELFPNGRFNMVLAGRIVPDKGHEDAILAVYKMIQDNCENIHLYIAGSSPSSGKQYEDKLKNMIEKYSLQDKVTFLGEVQNMREIRKDMDIELVCSVCETFGRVTVEGMRNGLLVIGSNTGGTPEIIQDNETGYLYEQGNPSDLARILKMVYHNPDRGREIAMAGYVMSQKKFTEEDNVRRIYEVMCELCN